MVQLSESRTANSEACAFFPLSPQQTSVEEIPATARQTTSNEQLRDGREHRELLLDRPSDGQSISPVGLQVRIGLPQKDRKKKVQKHQQEVFNETKDTVSVQPLRKMDCKQKSDGLSVPTQLSQDHTPSYGLTKEEASVPKVPPAYTGDHKHISAQMSMDVPPLELEKICSVLPPGTEKIAPCKPLRTKDRSARAKGQQDCKSQVSASVETLDVIRHGTTSDVRSETLQHDDNPSQTTTEAISFTVELKDHSSKQGSQETDSVQIDFVSELKDTKETQKHNSPIPASSHVITPLETTKGIKPIPTIKPKPGLINDAQTAPLSIIKKIHLPKRLPKRSLYQKSYKMDSDKLSIAQSFVANSESVKPVQIADMEEIKQPLTGDSTVETINITCSLKSENIPVIAESNKHPLPRARVRKCISGPVPDGFTTTTPTESTAEVFHKEEAQAAGQGGSICLTVMQHNKDLSALSLGVQPSTSTQKMPAVRLRRSRLIVETIPQAESGDTSDKAPSDMPVPKPRVKKRLSDSFPHDVTISGLPSPCQPGGVGEKISPETVQQNEPSGFPVPLPRAKKRLSATYSDNTGDHLEKELSQKITEDTLVSSMETKANASSTDSSMISERGFVTVQDDVASGLEQEVLAAMQEEECLQADTVEDTGKVLEEMIDDWTFTDEAVGSEKPTEMVSEQASVDRSLASSTVASSQDDWLHVEDDKGSEPVDFNSKKQTKDEDLDFGFVSVDVTAGCLEQQR